MRAWSILTLLGVAAVCASAASAAPIVMPATNLDVYQVMTTVDMLKGADCTSITVTELVYAPGSGGGAAALILGTAGPDSINGLGNSDCIYGGGGDDDLRGNGGFDVCIGGPGNDSFSGCEIQIQ